MHPGQRQDAFLELLKLLFSRGFYVHRILIDSEQSVIGLNALWYLIQGRHNVPLSGLGSHHGLTRLLLSRSFQVIDLNLHARGVYAVGGLCQGNIVVQLAEEILNLPRIAALRHSVHLL